MIVEPCTTEARKKLHYSTNLAPDRHAPRTPGRSGRTLCGQYARDEERSNRPGSGHKPVAVASLTPCLPCERAVTKLTEGTE